MQDNSDYYTVRFRVNKFQLSKFDEAKKKGITQKMVMQAFCQHCADIEIKVFDKNNEEFVVFPKGFLSKK